MLQERTCHCLQLAVCFFQFGDVWRLNYHLFHIEERFFPHVFHLCRPCLRAQVTTDFGYEFCFEAPNGSVKWYKAGNMVKGGADNTVNGRIPAPDDSKFIPLFTI